MANEQHNSCVEHCRADAATDIEQHDSRETFGWDKDAAKALDDVEIDAVAELQKRLFAQRERGVLVVLQATDAGGKGGTIRSVMNGLNPAGVSVHVFGAPSEEELAHDYLWRIHAHTPERGKIAIFDRSHYEDVLAVRVRQLVAEDVWRRRYEHIRNFEQMLVDEGFDVIKIFLNLSSEEQRERLQDRIDSPDEHWKFRAGDLEDRELWDEYRAAFQEMIVETSTAAAPWYVVPADRKWVRNLTVAKILRHHLERIDPQYPPAEDGIEDIVVE